MPEIPTAYAVIFWAAVTVLFAVVEAMTAQLVSIWFVVGAIASLICALCDVSTAIQIAVFAAVTILALIITRPLVKKYINPKKEYTNADRVVGQTGIVVEEIDAIKSTGQVKADGKIWSAVSSDGSIIENGSLVAIEKIEGVKLVVKK